MERPVSFDVTDYNPDGDDWMSGPSTPLINQSPKVESPDEDATDCVEITLDIKDNAMYISNVRHFYDGSVEENAEPMVGRGKKKKNKQSVVKRQEPSRLKYESSEVFKGLKMFISMTNGGWMAVERRFDNMTANTDGLLDPSHFGECLGINSKEFALELFYTLGRQRDVSCEGVSKCELLELWCHINDQSFDSRFRMFFDMADKDDDGRLSEEEVKEFIRLTASANNQSTTQNMVDKYAAVIMKELDPHNFDYIMIESLEALMLDVEAHPENKITSTDQETKKPTPRRWYNKVIRDIPSSSLIPCLKKTSSTKKKT